MSLTELPSVSPLGMRAVLSPPALAHRERASATIDTIALVMFTITIFTSATLLFVVQPMVGKLLLPKLGGAPAVWNTCMLFFQATLLAGYLSAHLMTRYLPLRGQVLLFLCGLALALTRLPLSIDPRSVESLLQGADPNFWLLGVLVLRVAPVFFMLSITSPLLQNWFSRSGHPQGNDPYFLYSASNIGSILSLVLYPFLVEVTWGVNEQTQSWMWGFCAFISLAAVCGWVGCRGAARGLRQMPSASDTHAGTANATPVAR